MWDLKIHAMLYFCYLVLLRLPIGGVSILLSRSLYCEVWSVQQWGMVWPLCLIVQAMYRRLSNFFCFLLVGWPSCYPAFLLLCNVNDVVTRCELLWSKENLDVIMGSILLTVHATGWWLSIFFFFFVSYTSYN